MSPGRYGNRVGVIILDPAGKLRLEIDQRLRQGVRVFLVRKPKKVVDEPRAPVE